MEFRDYQIEIIEKGAKKLLSLKIIMLAMEVRTGKTLTSLGIADKIGAKKVLFITKKKVITSKTVINDFNKLNPNFEIELINYESIHKLIKPNHDLIIIDESHSIGAFPKPSLRTKRIKEISKGKHIILLTGTPTPESWSQIYHQLWISDYTPFIEKTFYVWARKYVNVRKVKNQKGDLVNNYDKAKIKILQDILDKYIISFTQKQSGFATQVTEKVLYVKMKDLTYNIVRKLKNNRVIKGKYGGVILADTPAKMMQKVHQLYSGTIKLEDGSTYIIDYSKAEFIKDKFKNNKIAIFYKFKEELNLLNNCFGDNLTNDLEEFNNSRKNIALQIVSGREGISLAKADFIVFYNIDFSATSYFQARDRLTTIDRKENTVYWIFAEGGIEDQIYKTVQKKKNYTTKHYERSNFSKKNN